MSNCAPSLLYRTNDGLITLRNCECWECTRCAPRLAAKWARRLRLAMIEAGEHPNWCFWTFTQSPRVTTPEQAFSLMPRQWDVFRQRLQAHCKRRGYKPEYVCKLEPHIARGGVPHLHVICHMEPADSTGKADALACGYGYVSDVRVVGKEAAYYVTKYTAKAIAAGITWPKHTRRVNASRGFAPQEVASPGEWLVQMPRETLRGFALRAAYATGEEPDIIEEAMLDALDAK